MEIKGQTVSSTPRREPWNKGKLIGQKPPLAAKTCLVDPHQTADGWVDA